MKKYELMCYIEKDDNIVEEMSEYYTLYCDEKNVDIFANEVWKMVSKLPFYAFYEI